MTKTEKIEAIKNYVNSIENLETRLIDKGITYSNYKNGLFNTGCLYSVFQDVAYPAEDEHILLLPHNNLEREYEKKCSKLINEKIASIEELSGLEDLRIERYEHHNTIYVNSDLVAKYKEGTLDTDAIYKKVVEVIISLKDDFAKEYNKIILDAERRMDINEMFSRNSHDKNAILLYSRQMMDYYKNNPEKISVNTENRTYNFFDSDISVLKIMEKYDLVDLNSIKENIETYKWNYIDFENIVSIPHNNIEPDSNIPVDEDFEEEFKDLKIWQSVGAVFVEDKDNNIFYSGFYYDGRSNDENIYGPDSFTPFEMKTDNNEMLFEIFDKIYNKNCELSKSNEKLSIDDIEHIVEETYNEYGNDLQNDEKSDI